jgi:hypothetical protein
MDKKSREMSAEYHYQHGRKDFSGYLDSYAQTKETQAEEVYNKLSERGGPISSILDDSARRLADGENAGQVKAETYQRIRAEISQTLGGAKGPGAQGSEGTSETDNAPDDKGSIDLFSPEEPRNEPTFYSKAARVAFDKLPTSMSGDSA